LLRRSQGREKPFFCHDFGNEDKKKRMKKPNLTVCRRQHPRHRRHMEKSLDSHGTSRRASSPHLAWNRRAARRRGTQRRQADGRDRLARIVQFPEAGATAIGNCALRGSPSNPSTPITPCRWRGTRSAICTKPQSIAQRRNSRRRGVRREAHNRPHPRPNAPAVETPLDAVCRTT